MLASSMQFSSYDRSLVFSPHLIVIDDQFEETKSVIGLFTVQLKLLIAYRDCRFRTQQRARESSIFHFFEQTITLNVM